MAVLETRDVRDSDSRDTGWRRWRFAEACNIVPPRRSEPCAIAAGGDAEEMQ